MGDRARVTNGHIDAGDADSDVDGGRTIGDAGAIKGGDIAGTRGCISAPVGGGVPVGIASPAIPSARDTIGDFPIEKPAYDEGDEQKGEEDFFGQWFVHDVFLVYSFYSIFRSSISQ